MFGPTVPSPPHRSNDEPFSKNILLEGTLLRDKIMVEFPRDYSISSYHEVLLEAAKKIVFVDEKFHAKTVST